MPKPSATLARIKAEAEAKYNALFHLKMDMLMQMGQDAAMIAAHEVLQLGPGRSEAFLHRIHRSHERYGTDGL